AFAQVARGVGGGGRLTLLLMLAVGLGLFALTFQASLGKNVHDRAAYLAGSDELAQVTQGAENSALTLRYAHLPGVTASMPAYRTHATLVSDPGIQDAQVLAIPPALGGQVIYWRDDYADQPLTTLLAQMQAHTQGPRAGDPDHPIWALVDLSLAGTLSLHIGDSFTLTLQYSSIP